MKKLYDSDFNMRKGFYEQSRQFAKKQSKPIKKLNKIERKVLESEFQETYNPTKLYQRIRVLGVPKDRARKLCKYYEDVVYKPLCRAYDMYQRKEKQERKFNNL